MVSLFGCPLLDWRRREQLRKQICAKLDRKYVMKLQGLPYCKATIGQIGVGPFAFALFVLVELQLVRRRAALVDTKRVKILAGSEQPIQRFGEKALSLIRWAPVGCLYAQWAPSLLGPLLLSQQLGWPCKCSSILLACNFT